MLRSSRRGEEIVKAELYKRLAPEVGRSAKSIEWKLRNVSAVFEELGIAWPASHALVDAVGAQLRTNPHLMAIVEKPRFAETGELCWSIRPVFGNLSSESRPKALLLPVSKYDPAKRDEFNRSHSGTVSGCSTSSRLWTPV